MAPFVGLIKDLQPGKSKYTLRLRLIRSYKIPQIQNPDEVHSHEMVLHDHEGNRIHGSIEKASIPAFQDKLHEGNVYLMMNFIVAPNMMRTKTTTCPYKIILFKQTRMSEILDDSFPSYLLNLKSFDKIVSLEKKLDTPLFDAMGIVVKHFDVEEKSINGRMAKSLDIIIEDHEKKKMKCTLWDAYADEVDGIIKDHIKDGLEEPIAVVLRLTKNMRLQNMSSTDEAMELEEFSKWIAGIGDGTVGGSNDGHVNIYIPDDILMKWSGNPIECIVNSTYPSYCIDSENTVYLQERAILAPTLNVVEYVNQYIISLNENDGVLYRSSDSLCKSDSNTDLMQQVHTPEFLNSIKCSGVPNHEVYLKVGTPSCC